MYMNEGAAYRTDGRKCEAFFYGGRQITCQVEKSFAS
jgi:hypothetical protein